MKQELVALNSLSPKRQNLVDQYLARRGNLVICIDVTKIGKIGYLLLTLDLAARVIPAVCFREGDITSSDVVDTFELAFKQREFTPPIQCIHSDRASIFVAEPFVRFCEKHGIHRSRADSKAHGNQVIERHIRTVKTELRKRLGLAPFKEDYDPLDYLDAPFATVEEKLREVMAWYHFKPHKHLSGMSPCIMELALFQKYEIEHLLEKQFSQENKFLARPSGGPVVLEGEIVNVEYLALNDASHEADLIRQYKEQAIREYNGDWGKLILQMKHQTSAQLDFIKKQNEHLAVQSDFLKSQNEELIRMNQQQSAELSFLREVAEDVKTREEEKRARRIKRQRAAKRPLRDHLTQDEFFQIFDLITEKSYVANRTRSAILLLYLTGLRISNLLELKVRNIQELFSDGETVISLIKNGDRRHMLTLGPQGKYLFKKYYGVFFQVLTDKQPDDFVFTAEESRTTPIDRSNFDKQINTILHKGSALLGKHIRSHSFRATFITDLLEENPIDHVRDVIGHRSIMTTQVYNRSRLTKEQRKSIFKKLDDARRRKVSAQKQPETAE